MTAPLDPSIFLEPVPSPGEKAMYDKFLDEYVKDFNALEACIRIGFQYLFAMEYAKTIILKPYVQREIMRRKENARDEKDEDKVARHRALIENTLVEAMQNGQTATRVAAAKTLAGIHGIDQAPDRSGEAVTKLVDDLKKVATLLPD